MNNFNDLQLDVQILDQWTQMSILGSWQFMVHSALISQISREIPDAPEEGSGIDGFTPYEDARRELFNKLVKDSERPGDGRSQVPSLLALNHRINDMFYELDGAQMRSIHDTYAWMSERVPTRAQFEGEFASRIKAGMRPGIPRKVFVDAEYAKAMEQHEKLLTKGEDACRLVETLPISAERGVEDMPEWTREALINKLIDKLDRRWFKLEMDRTNPRRGKALRDQAEGDQMLISEVMRKYGVTPGFGDDADDEAGDE